MVVASVRRAGYVMMRICAGIILFSNLAVVFGGKGEVAFTPGKPWDEYTGNLCPRSNQRSKFMKNLISMKFVSNFIYVSWTSYCKNIHVKSIFLTRIIYTFYAILQTIIKLKFIASAYKKMLFPNKYLAEHHNFRVLLY
jgi:hypothetical protein